MAMLPLPHSPAPKDYRKTMRAHEGMPIPADEDYRPGHRTFTRDIRGPALPSSALIPGALYREAGAFADQTRFFAVDRSGCRCFEVTVLTERVSVDLFERWAETAAIVAGCRPRPSLVERDVTPRPQRSRASGVPHERARTKP